MTLGLLVDAILARESQVELRGLDVYDPTTGEIRSDTTDEIACWSVELAPQQASSPTPGLAGSATSCSTRRVRLRPAVLSSSRSNGGHGFFIHMA